MIKVRLSKVLRVQGVAASLGSLHRDIPNWDLLGRLGAQCMFNSEAGVSGGIPSCFPLQTSKQATPILISQNAQPSETAYVPPSFGLVSEESQGTPLCLGVPYL